MPNRAECLQVPNEDDSCKCANNHKGKVPTNVRNTCRQVFQVRERKQNSKKSLTRFQNAPGDVSVFFVIHGCRVEHDDVDEHSEQGDTPEGDEVSEQRE